METDPDQFECEGCGVAEALDSLDAENRHAWTLSRQVLTRFTVERGCVAFALDRITADWPPEAVVDLLERLNLIHHELWPLPVAPTESA